MPGFSGTGAVTRSTLRQQIADALRDEVLSGRLQPGREFTVKEIAEQYGVSATPVREALVDLSAQGLLDADQHRGFRVRVYSAAAFREMIEARALVTEGMFRVLAAAGEAPGGAAETGGARGRPRTRAMPREPLDPRTAAVLAGVRRRGEEAQRAASAGDLTVLIGYDLRFWRELSALYGNAHLADFLHRLRVQSWVCAVQQLRGLGDLRGVLWCGHTELVDALASRDIATAQTLVSAYNAHSLALVERLCAA